MATADPGWRFNSWGNACASFSEPSCELTLDGDAVASVLFSRVVTATLPVQHSRGKPPPPPPKPPPAPPPSPPAPQPPPPPQPSPTGGPSGAPLGLVDRELARLRKASIAFNVPTTLRLGHSTEIQLLLSPRKNVRALKGQIQAPGSREGASIKFASLMEAHLTGIGFKIEAVTPEIQAVSETDVTEWAWEIEPTQTGVQRLHLTMIAHIGAASDPRTVHTIRTFSRTMTVKVTWYERFSTFLGDNWKWLWTAILVPAAGLALRRRKRASG